MNRLILVLGIFLTILIYIPVRANNITVSSNLELDIAGMEESQNNPVFVRVKFNVQWENSWRDDFNWDAAYIFLKFRQKGANNVWGEWRTARLRDYAPIADVQNYDYYMANVNGTAERDNAQGIFVYRKNNGAGDANVNMTLQWNLAADGLSKTHLVQNEVEYTAMCIETVYIPNGAYYLGDNYSARGFMSSYQPIPERLDVIRNGGGMAFDGDALVGSDAYKQYPPSNAANRTNVYGTDLGNAWRSSQVKAGYWQVKFNDPKIIKYFAISGASGVAAPKEWALYGLQSDMGTKTELYRSSSNAAQAALEWPNSDYGTYPARQALKINTPQPYYIYRIEILDATVAPAINNVAMTDSVLGGKADYAFVVDNVADGSTLMMSANSVTPGLYSEDEKSIWSGPLDARYPTGSRGFFIMKYEVSQEQYVKFLNKLTLTQQKARTIGNNLTTLNVGDFVYGTDKTKPNFRNTIVIATQSTANSPVVFANNYNYSAEEGMSQPNDGKTIACNYLSPQDMLAYADWVGLRPMSEMEFEKAVRRPFPELPENKEFAWNSGDESTFKISSTVTEGGTSAERVGDGANVNADNNIDGPVRCGSFASGALGKQAAGASFWGVMELSGNLSEIYYNVNTYGRGFLGNLPAVHGNGTINTAGNGDVGNWPTDIRSFGLRGGSFKSSTWECAVSDRTNARFYSEKNKDINHKDSTVSFRLGYSYSSVKNPTSFSYLRLENGRQSTGGTDSVCSGVEYTIWGSDILVSSSNQTPLAYKGRVEYIWYSSENGGTTWMIIPNARDKDLKYVYTNEGSTVRAVHVKRVAVTPEVVSVSGNVILQVINAYYNVHRMADTINAYSQVLGCLVETKMASTYSWRLKGEGITPLKTTTNAVSSYYYAKRSDFGNVSDKTFTVECEIRTLKCVNKVEVKIQVKPRKKTGVLSADMTLDGALDKRCGQEIMDARDGNIYGTVRIDNQCWMAENLRKNVQGQTYYQAIDMDGRNIGSLYVHNATVVNDACPPGWKLPTNADIIALKTFLNNDGAGNAGRKLKAGNYWAVTSANYRMMGTNTTGFGAVGAGHYNGSYVETNAYFLTEEGYYWYLSVESKNLMIPYPGVDYNESYSFYYYYGAGSTAMSIRCILKDKL